MAADADLAIIVAGYTFKDEGENAFFQGGDRKSLRLHDKDEAMIHAVAAANPRCIVVLEGGSGIITTPWRDEVQAILMAWYPGMEGGNAIADILDGSSNPSGRLPLSFPDSESELPFFDPFADTIEYDLYHGYRLLDRNKKHVEFPFGFGLSYTSFTYENMALDRASVSKDGTIKVNVDVKNAGALEGQEVIQVYAGYKHGKVDRPVKELKGFTKVALGPGEHARATIEIQASQLSYYDEGTRSFVVEPGEHAILVGPSADNDALIERKIVIE